MAVEFESIRLKKSLNLRKRIKVLSVNSDVDISEMIDKLVSKEESRVMALSKK